MAAIDAALKAISDSDAGKVPATRAVLGLPLSADITLAQFIVAGLAAGTNGQANDSAMLGGVDAANFPQISSGVWTPTLFGDSTAGSPTYTQQAGMWYKIGELVVILLLIQISSKGGMAGNVRVGGLPFIPRQYGAGNFTFGEHSGISLPDGNALSTSPVDPDGVPLVSAGNNGTGLVDASLLSDSWTMWDGGAGFYLTN